MHTHTQGKEKGGESGESGSHMHMEFTYQLAFLCQVEQAEGNNARKAPLSNPSPPSLP